MSGYGGGNPSEGGGTPASTVTDETTFGVAAAVGVGTDYARADHTHGSPTNPITAHEAAADPHPVYQKESEKAAASGYASLDGTTKVPMAQLPDASTTAKGVVELATSAEITAGLAVQASDTRLSDVRTPTTHNILTLHNGFPGGGTTFLRDDGTFATPPAGGSPPTGTGFRHITSGAEDAASKLVDTADINNDQVTPAKLDDGSGFSVLGKATTGAGDRADIVAADETVLGRTAAGTLSFAQVATGQIAAAAVTLAKIANIATARLLGRVTAGSGVIEELTAAQATALLDIFTSALQGLVPASGGGTSNFLRADGTWAAPAGGSFGFTKAAGTTVVAATDLTWLVLDANSGSITGTAFVTVMTITGVGPGRYHFICRLIYQTTATTTGINVTATHTGTTTQWIMWASVPTTGGAAATKAATSAAQGSAQGMWETEVELTKGAAIGTLSNFVISVHAANLDQIVVIEGLCVVTVSGDLQIQLSAELAALVCTARQKSFLELRKLS